MFLGTNTVAVDMTSSIACTRSTKLLLLWYSANQTCVTLSRFKSRSNRIKNIWTRGDDGCSAGPLSTIKIKALLSRPVLGLQKTKSKLGFDKRRKISLKSPIVVSGSSSDRFRSVTALLERVTWITVSEFAKVTSKLCNERFDSFHGGVVWHLQCFVYMSLCSYSRNLKICRKMLYSTFLNLHFSLIERHLYSNEKASFFEYPLYFYWISIFDLCFSTFTWPRQLLLLNFFPCLVTFIT
jgi:hypothetical protein